MIASALAMFDNYLRCAGTGLPIPTWPVAGQLR